ncbi:MAG: hypothetical protein JRD89_03010 [Deltaproteobacteria bacterium]|nr:hypothetical protein [Deltaproteobacteria bacterium]
MPTKREILAAEIIARSNSDSWELARREWVLSEVYLVDPKAPKTCLCTHHPIVEICVIDNRHNGASTEVGNVCVSQFLMLPSHKIFDALRRVRTNEVRALNVEAIEHGHGRGWFNDWERRFYLRTWRLRALSRKQLAKRVQLNRKFVERTAR